MSEEKVDPKEKMKVYQREWVAARRNKYVSELGPCFFCGSNENIQIHHVDPEQKESHKIWSWREDRIKAELAKCVPMCDPCHNKFHGLLKRKPLVHGTLHGYQRYKCRCDECKKARSDYYWEHENVANKSMA
jgi:hypothetical protein